jgi:DNA polymerase III epsilon subunit-like protein
MPYLALDTETTGLPSKRTKDYKNLAVYDSCRIVSVAAVLYSDSDEEICSIHKIVQPDGYQVTATEIHGITHEKAVEEGSPFSSVWKRLESLFKENPVVVGHNLEFDLNVLKSEAFRRGFSTDCFTGITEVCTQKMAKDIYKKSYRLGAIYEELTKEPLAGWHGALADARAAAVVFKIMKRHVPAPVQDSKEIVSKKIIIKASEVAACIGKNPYKKPQEVADEIWKKHNPDNFKGITKNDLAKAHIAKSEVAQSTLAEAVSSRADQSTDTQSIVRIAQEKVNADTSLTQTQKREVNDYIRSKVFTNFGTKSEDKTSDKVEAAEGVKLERDDNFYSIEIATIHGTRYVITGKIDRIEVQPDGSRVLVEIKNRTRGLFNMVRVYEMIQVQTYLQMTGLTSARLVEQYNEETSSSSIVRDQEFWDKTVMPKLVSFCQEIHNKMSN